MSKLSKGYIDHVDVLGSESCGKDFMIPEGKISGVARALRETFGVTEFEDIHRVTKGLSSDLGFRVVVGISIPVTGHDPYG